MLQSDSVESSANGMLSLVKGRTEKGGAGAASGVPSCASVEGLAIAQRLSNKHLVIPKGFSVTANHFSLQGQAVIEGTVNSVISSHESVEVLPGGHLLGSFTGGELVVSGQVDASLVLNKLHLKRGSLCKGSIEGRSVLLDEGAHLEASCRIGCGLG